MAATTQETTKTIPVQRWGKDHWATFAYVECRCVDNKGKLAREQMRTDEDLHPGWGDARNDFGDNKKYPTRIKLGAKAQAKYDGLITTFDEDEGRAARTQHVRSEEVEDHDDWSCVEDMIAAGLVTTDDLKSAQVQLTDEGWRVISALRRFKADGGNFHNFAWPTEQA